MTFKKACRKAYTSKRFFRRGIGSDCWIELYHDGATFRFTFHTPEDPDGAETRFTIFDFEANDWEVVR